MKKKIIITGVTGQMGSHLVDQYLEKGYDVYGTLRRTSVPNLKNLRAAANNPNFNLEVMDLGDAPSINRLVASVKPDIFVNCAANSFVGTSWTLPEQHIEFNTLGVLRQLEAIKSQGRPVKYLNFGSSEEFGNVAESPQSEKTELRARSPYAVSKIAARHLVKVYRESYGMFAIQPWCFNYEGPRRGDEFVTQKIVKGLVRRLAALIESRAKAFWSEESLKLGNLNPRRDWSHAKDFAKGIDLMLNQNEPKEFVLSSGKTHSIREFVSETLRAIEEVSGEDFSNLGIALNWKGHGEQEKLMVTVAGNEQRPLIEVSPEFFRPCEVELLIGNSSKIRSDLGWKPDFDFRGLVKDMVEAEY
jgi:GDPmannose 4,6-dehydratase